MTIKIKENQGGHIKIKMEWTSRFQKESKEREIENYTIGKKPEEVCKRILVLLKDAKSAGRLRF